MMMYFKYAILYVFTLIFSSIIFNGDLVFSQSHPANASVTKGNKQNTNKTDDHRSHFIDPITDMEFVYVKAGCYEMGDIFGDGHPDQRPVHEVCVDGFYMGKYEVTQKQWESIMNNNPLHLKKGDNYPINFVSWNDAQEFIVKLNKRSNKIYRLPTEAEWEYAARSCGQKEKYAGTHDEAKIGEYAWYSKNTEYAKLVGLKKPNHIGLYDMSGNVWEWVQDWYAEDYYKISPRGNPTGPTSGNWRVLRGGYDAYMVADDVRVTNRYFYIPYKNDMPIAGFRLAFSE